MFCSEIELDRDWFDLGEDSSTRITKFSFAAVPVMCITLRDSLSQLILVDFGWVRLGFIQTEDVGVFSFHEVNKRALVNDCINPIDIPGRYINFMALKIIHLRGPSANNWRLIFHAIAVVKEISYCSLG